MSIPLAAYGNLIMWGILYVEATAIYREWARECLLEENEELPITYLIGSILPAEFYYKAQKLRELLRQQVMQVLEDVDVLISPTVESVAPSVSKETPTVTKESVIENLVRAPLHGHHPPIHWRAYRPIKPTLWVRVGRGWNAHRVADRG